MKEKWTRPVLVLTAVLALATLRAAAWERGAHAGHWKKGQTIKVCVDKPPAGKEQECNDAVDDAMKEWNDAQAPFGGLKLQKSDREPCDVKIHWGANMENWGTTSSGAPPIDVTIETADGINARGLKRSLKHELGHMEGLGHSEKSDAVNPRAPTRDEKNDPGPILGPNDDDKAGKKALYGTVEKQAKAAVKGTASRDQGRAVWVYNYTLTAQKGPRLRMPITELSLTFPRGLRQEDLRVVRLPARWQSKFYPGGAPPMRPGAKPEDREPPPPPTLSFTVPVAEFGAGPGKSVAFRIESKLPPSPRRAFTNSPSHDSDEFQLPVPSRG